MAEIRLREERGAGAVNVAAHPARDRWHQFLELKCLKSTVARNTIVDVFLRAEGHVSLAAIEALARRRVANIGLATVYRTMKLLEEAGIAERREFQGAGGGLYELTLGRGHHDHLICLSCGTVLEFEDPEIWRLQEQAAAARDFVIKGRRHEVYGICPGCRPDQNPRPAAT